MSDSDQPLQLLPLASHNDQLLDNMDVDMGLNNALDDNSESHNVDDASLFDMDLDNTATSQNQLLDFPLQNNGSPDAFAHDPALDHDQPLDQASARPEFLDQQDVDSDSLLLRQLGHVDQTELPTADGTPDFPDVHDGALDLRATSPVKREDADQELADSLAQTPKPSSSQSGATPAEVDNSDPERPQNGSMDLTKKLLKLEAERVDERVEDSDLDDADLDQPVDVNADDATRIRQTHAIIIPLHSSWFNMKKIHQIERDSLPEFFDTTHPSKSPMIYANYRNFMINAYRLNPNEYLTLTSCRRTLVGDVSTLMRVHRFLNKWGLINYQVNPQFKPAYALEKMPNGAQVGLPYCGDFHVQYDTPRGLFPFNTFKPSKSNLNSEKLKELIEAAPSRADDSKMEDVVKTDADDQPPLKKQRVASDDWTPEELASLLLAVAKHPNDWYMVSKSVGTRTPQECILKFLKIPIEDDYNKIDDKDLGVLKYASNFPVISADNPVIGNLIFMTNLVDPEVVKAASRDASRVIDAEFMNKVKRIHGEKKKKAEQSESNGEDEFLKDVDMQSEASDTAENDKPSTESVNKQLVDEYNTHEKKDPSEILQEASTTILGSIGARSHLFANYEEREMQKLMNSILNHELSKLEVKTKKVNELEKIYQRERRNLAHQRNEIFIDRLALSKSTIGISRKLNEAMLLLNASQGKEEGAEAPKIDLGQVSKILGDAQTLLLKPVKLSLFEEASTAVEKDSKEDEPTGEKDVEKNNLPVSVVAPKLFKVWAP